MVDVYNREDCFIISRFAMSPKCTRFVKGKFFLNDSGLSVKTKANTLSQKFVDIALWANNDTIYSFGKGMAQKNLDIPSFRDLVIPVPPLAEQERIVAELDLLTGIIDKQKAQLKELDTLAQSIFYDMFGDPVENEKGWDVKKLSSITTKIGSGATPKGGNESYKSEGISLIRSLNVHNNEFLFKDLAYIDDEQANALNNVEIKKDDVLLNITGASVARCCIVPNGVLPARVNQHVCIIRTIADKALPIYINRLLTNEHYQMALLSLARSKAATREALPKSLVDNLPIPLPPLSLQQSFTDKINVIEQQKAAITQSIAETQKLFDYTMDKYFG